MPVIIEEIVGRVEPEAPGAANPGEVQRAVAQGRALPDPRAVREQVNRMARRQARLRAD